jgi:transposase
VANAPPTTPRGRSPERARGALRAPRGVFATLREAIHKPQRRELRKRGISAEIARRQTEHGSGVGRYRWVVERTFAWLHQFKRLLVRYDRRAEIHEAFLSIGCCLVCYRRLRNASL